MNHQTKGDNECQDISINVKGRIYSLKIPEDEIFERTARFQKELRRFRINSSFEQIDRMAAKKRLRLCYQYVEDLFGKGICERYFGADRCNMSEMMSLLSFIADELEKQRESRRIDNLLAVK